MILKYILLALSASIDALSLGITYGIGCSTAAILLGHFLSLLFSPSFSILLGSSLLIMLGLYNIYKGLKHSNTFINFDVDNSNRIDNKEATLLGLAVAVDASCVSMGAGIIGYISFILPILMASFHTFFVNCGNFIAKSAVERLNIPSNVLSIFSGILLILIGILRIIF